jgi:hypothetical protein
MMSDNWPKNIRHSEITKKRVEDQADHVTVSLPYAISNVKREVILWS